MGKKDSGSTSSTSRQASNIAQPYKLTDEDVREGRSTVISIKLTEPQFEESLLPIATLLPNYAVGQ